MRILVGTLYSGESEFRDCVAAVQRQTMRDFEHFVIEGLPKREAHDALYGRFMERADEFDLFLKLDADMVIISCELFARIVERFRANSEMDVLTIEVRDFLSDRQIDGLHVFRNTVRWEKRDNEIFTDRHTVPPERCVYDRTQLAPAAIHCGNPSPFQAFHYGLHRALKIRAYLGSKDPLRTNLRFHLDNREAVWRHFVRTGDVRPGFASLGAEIALMGEVDYANIAYSDPTARQLFDARYSSWHAGRIRTTVRWMRLRNALFRSGLLRYRVLRFERERVDRWLGIVARVLHRGTAQTGERGRA